MDGDGTEQGHFQTSSGTIVFLERDSGSPTCCRVGKEAEKAQGSDPTAHSHARSPLIRWGVGSDRGGITAARAHRACAHQAS